MHGLRYDQIIEPAVNRFNQARNFRDALVENRKFAALLTEDEWKRLQVLVNNFDHHGVLEFFKRIGTRLTYEAIEKMRKENQHGTKRKRRKASLSGPGPD